MTVGTKRSTKPWFRQNLIRPRCSECGRPADALHLLWPWFGSDDVRPRGQNGPYEIRPATLLRDAIPEERTGVKLSCPSHDFGGYMIPFRREDGRGLTEDLDFWRAHMASTKHAGIVGSLFHWLYGTPEGRWVVEQVGGWSKQ